MPQKYDVIDFPNMRWKPIWPRRRGASHHINEESAFNIHCAFESIGGVSIRQDASPRQARPSGHCLAAAVTFSKILTISKISNTTRTCCKNIRWHLYNVFWSHLGIHKHLMNASKIRLHRFPQYALKTNLAPQKGRFAPLKWKKRVKHTACIRKHWWGEHPSGCEPPAGPPRWALPCSSCRFFKNWQCHTYML